MDGFGVLAPYADRIGVLTPAGGDDPEVAVWEAGTSAPLSGIDGTPDQMRWADETTLLVSAHDSSGSSLYACGLEGACERLPVDGEVSLNR